MVNVDTFEKATVIRFHKPMHCISAALWGGGVRTVTTVINYTLAPDEGLTIKQMKDVCPSLARQYGCDPDYTVVLITAVPQVAGEWSVCGQCFMTAGLGNASGLFPEVVWDERRDQICPVGTINSVHILSESMTEEALIEAHSIAKVSVAHNVLQWNDWYHNDGVMRMGTTTDRPVVVAPYQTPSLQLAGIGTKIGYDIAIATESSFAKAVRHKYPDYVTQVSKKQNPGA